MLIFFPVSAHLTSNKSQVTKLASSLLWYQAASQLPLAPKPSWCMTPVHSALKTARNPCLLP